MIPLKINNYNHMNKIKLLSIGIIFMLSVAFAFSQENSTYTVAFTNTKELLEQFPEKEQATQKLLELSENYKKELEIMQNEYNKKYSDYITYQSSLAENIKLRRMQELTELENKMQQFMQLAQKDIEQQEQLLLNPLKEKIMKAISEVGVENYFIVIYDLADPGIAFINPAAIDATPLVKKKLNIH